jgi:tRNA(adenine34) deaminase
MDIFSDEYFMKQALQEAQKAFDKDEVPIGAVIMSDNRIIARAHNLTEQLNDFTAHAEMQAFTSASNYLGSKYLDECTLYVTLEPCIMCAGAAFWTRIGRIVYGASDLKRGFIKCPDKLIHNKTELTGGVLAAECSKIVEDFFKQKRE